MNYYLTVLKKYAVFSGRAQRAEYWYFVLFNIIVSIVLGAIDGGFGLKIGSGAAATGILGGIYSLAVIIPGLAVFVRRLHDIGKSGWMILVGLIPIAGAIWLIVLAATDGNPGDNKYGSNPKQTVATPVAPISTSTPTV